MPLASTLFLISLRSWSPKNHYFILDNKCLQTIAIFSISLIPLLLCHWIAWDTLYLWSPTPIFVSAIIRVLGNHNKWLNREPHKYHRKLGFLCCMHADSSSGVEYWAWRQKHQSHGNHNEQYVLPLRGARHPACQRGHFPFDPLYLESTHEMDLGRGCSYPVHEAHRSCWTRRACPTFSRFWPRIMACRTPKWSYVRWAPTCPTDTARTPPAPPVIGNYSLPVETVRPRCRRSPITNQAPTCGDLLPKKTYWPWRASRDGFVLESKELFKAVVNNSCSTTNCDNIRNIFILGTKYH